MTRMSAQPGNAQPPSRSNPSTILALALALAAACALPAPPARAETPPADETKRLEDLRERIESLEGDLGKSRTQRKEAHAQLREVERRIGGIAARIRQIAREEQEIRQRLEELAERERQLEARLAQHHDALERQVRSRYAQGGQGYLRLLLNQNDAGQIGRNLVYYRYLSQAHFAGIEAIEEDKARLDELRAQSQQRRDELLATGALLAEQRQSMAQEKSQRSGVLAELEQRIGSQKQKLEQMNADAARLEEVLRRLKAAPPPATPSKPPLVRGRGKLPWPVRGELLAGYGQPRNLGRLKWEGVLIGAAEGTEVVAIAAGRVVYADWLRGYGMLLIVDHGAGLFSLYGYNQELHKNAGDAVSQGELIARVGNSGGHDRPALYFEVRKDGKPSNPAAWCRGGPDG